MMELAGKQGERRLSKIGMEQMLVSMGHQACGAVTLRNYPSWMRSLIPHDINGEVQHPVDMTALEIARYNEYQRKLLMIPISRWEDLTDDEQVIEALSKFLVLNRERLFRRLEADRFSTINFNAQTYTDKGLEWVNKTESLKDVIDRHFPDMTRKWIRCSSAFSVWDAAPNKRNYIPLYLRSAP
ncbi:hypothetical protein PTKIN_Ptkin05aG0128900 [Pterospermum kingtungense]